MARGPGTGERQPDGSRCLRDRTPSGVGPPGAAPGPRAQAHGRGGRRTRRALPAHLHPPLPDPVQRSGPDAHRSADPADRPRPRHGDGHPPVRLARRRPLLHGGLPGRGLPQPPLVDTDGPALDGARRAHRLVDRHAPGSPGRHRRPRRPEGAHAARRPVRDVLLQPPRGLLRRPGVDEQRPGGRDLPGHGRVPGDTGALDPLPEHGQPRSGPRPDGLHAAASTSSSA